MRTCVTARPSSRLFTSGFTIFSRHSTSSAARPPAGGPPVSSPLRPRLEAVGVRKAVRSGTSTATVAHSVLDPFVPESSQQTPSTAGPSLAPLVT